MRKPLACIFLSLTTLSYANVGQDLDGFFNNLGYSSNVTNAGVFNSQAAGSFDGGSIFARNQVREYQFVQLDLPSYSAGCGGIDLHLGSLSFISKDKMIALGKSIMTDASSFAFDLALSTSLPEAKHVKDVLQQVEQFANNTNINSCETAKGFVNSVWEKTQSGNDTVCKEEGLLGKSGMFSDYSSARSGCSGSKHDEALEKASNNPSQASKLAYNKNIVWDLLKSKSFLASDNDMCELMMSVTGTLVFDKKGGVKNVPSLASSRSLIRAIVGDGSPVKAKIWRCTEYEKCLNLTLKEISIEPSNTLSFKVSKALDELRNILKKEKPLDEDIKKAQSFTAMVSLPVERFIEVLASTEYGEAAVNLDEYTTIIAHDLLQQYFAELLQEVSNTTMASQLNGDLVKDIKKRVSTAKYEINKLNPEINQKIQQKYTLIQNVKNIEKQLGTQLQEVLG